MSSISKVLPRLNSSFVIILIEEVVIYQGLNEIDGSCQLKIGCAGSLDQAECCTLEFCKSHQSFRIAQTLHSPDNPTHSKIGQETIHRDVFVRNVVFAVQFADKLIYLTIYLWYLLCSLELSIHIEPIDDPQPAFINDEAGGITNLPQRIA